MAEDWSARQYLKFEDERTRPPRDLLAQVPLDCPRRAVLRHRLEAVPRGGVLAVQMPDQTSEPALMLMEQVAGAGPWADTVAKADAAHNGLPSPGAYYDLLRPHCGHLDVWHTVYNH